MAVAPGSRLGPYQVLTPLGAGGMGEVWRARDTRLGREVAIKVLSAEVASNPARLRRFEKEAQSASALNHPNIVTVYEMGTTDTTSWIAMELVEGKTLRELLLPGPLSVKRLLGLATQLAEGLSRAHEAGIVHRDLKPENVMVTRDGLLKILDFGLAKLTHSSAGDGEGSRLTTETGTSPGVVLGTVCYMSPEQACGHPVDFRSDQFALGSIVYEMATGKRAFEKPNAPDTLSAILHHEPAPLTQTTPQAPPPLGWILERCLAKEPTDRYASTKDLARDLANLRDRASSASGSVASVPAPRPPRRIGRLAAAGVALVVGAVALFWSGRLVERSRASQPTYRQLTFRGAGIGTARFAPDGQTIVFSSQTDGKAPELFSMRLDSPEVRSLGLPPAHILSISRSGQMALLLLRPFALMPRVGHIGFEQILYRDPSLLEGTLAEAPLAGGSPRELLEDVSFADWAPNGTDLALIRRIGNRRRVEFPGGTSVWSLEREVLNHVRFFRDPPARLAFKDWGNIYLKDSDRTARLLAASEGVEIAWPDSAREVWFTNSTTEIDAVAAGGGERNVVRMPGDFVLYDVAADGRALLGRLVESTEILGTFPDAPRERNLSHFDLSIATALSPRGDELVFIDAAQSEAVFAGAPGAVYVRKTDGSPPKRVGDALYSVPALSPDGRLVLSRTFIEAAPGKPVERFLLIPTGPGETKSVEPAVHIQNTQGRFGFLPDGKSFFFPGAEEGRGTRVWLQSIEGGKPRPITPEGVDRPVLVGGGHLLCARGPDFQWHLYPVDGKGEPLKAMGIAPGEEPIQSSPDGLLYVRGADELRPGESLMTTRVYRVDPSTGRRELWKEIPPADTRTGGAVVTILFSADGKTCVWTHMRYSTELVLAEGLK